MTVERNLGDGSQWAPVQAGHRREEGMVCCEGKRLLGIAVEKNIRKK